jgi:hypothetical protein
LNGGKEMKNIEHSLLRFGLVLLLSISSWTPAVIISTHEENTKCSNRDAQIAVDAAGNSYITWQGYDGNDQEIYWVKIDAEGVPGQVQKVSIHPDNIYHKDSLPQVAVDAAGNSYITWQGYDGNDQEIYWVKIDAEGVPGQVQKVSIHPDCTDNHDFLPQIAVDAAGNSYITWQGYDGNDQEIYWVKIDAEGVPGQVQKVSIHPDNIDQSDIDPQIAVDTTGNSYIIWHGCDKENCWEEPGDLEIYWIKIDSEGTPRTVLKIPPTQPDNIDTMAMVPQLAVDASGNSHIVWSGVDEESYDIYWVKIDPTGNMGTVQRISANLNSSFDDVHPEIAVDTLGNLYITWEGSNGNKSEIYWVKIDVSGTIGTVQKISNYLFSSIYEDWDPQIAADAKGNSYATWNSFNGGFNELFDQSICWVKIDAEGNPGKVHKLSSHEYSQHFDGNSRICVDSEGNSYVIWVGEDTFEGSQIFFTACLHNPTLSMSLTIVLVMTAVMAALMAIFHKKIGQIFSLNKEKNSTQITEKYTNGSEKIK